MHYGKLIVFILLQVVMIFVYIDQQSRWIKLSYEKQEQEKELTIHIKTKQELLHQLHVLASNKTEIKEYASNQLKMKKMAITQIRKIEDNE
ncbi:MAG: hypothetical protein ACOYT8_02730 [Candidatus Dependentiae bacterium]